MVRSKVQPLKEVMGTSLGVDKLAHYWSMRFFHVLRGYEVCIGIDGFNFCRPVSNFLGITELMDNDPLSILQVRRSAALLLKSYQGKRPDLPKILSTNLQKMATVFGFDFVEQQVLLFVLVLNIVSPFQQLLDSIRNIEIDVVHYVMAVILDLPLVQVQKALKPDGILVRSGVLVENCNQCDFSEYYTMVSKKIALQLFNYEGSIVDIFLHSIKLVSAQSLTVEHYPYIKDDLEVLLSLMQKSLNNIGKLGCNIYLYGVPGSGKTQLPRVLGAHLGVPVYEIKAMDSHGNSLNPASRLSSLRLAQAVLGCKPKIIVLDEVEEIMDSGGNNPDLICRSSVQKSTMTSLMDELKDPIFWISNSGEMDPALARRFDLVIHMALPSAAYRLGMLEQLNQEACLPIPIIQQLAALDTLSPADVQRVMTVMGSVQADLPSSDREKLLYRVLNSRLELQSLPILQPLHLKSRSELPKTYDLAHLNPDHDLENLTQNLGRGEGATICLYGPPGTGKSAFAQWLARRLDRPLLVRRASDILRKYLGETEKKIASMFADAEEQKGILLLDEVDGFFLNRSNLQTNWQINIVNEFLTRMESFDGVFVATTNLLSVLDEAFMRRFDARIRFDYLNAEQVQRLYLQLIQDMGMEHHNTVSFANQHGFNCVTPGDFAVLRRRHRISAFANPQEVLAALRHEQSYKADQHGQGIGFIQN